MADVNINKFKFPIFTVAALVLIILKVTAFPAISWWLIAGEWLAPVIILLSLIGIIGTLFLCFLPTVFMIWMVLEIFK